MRDLDGKTAIITGAASGIGRGTALALSARNVKLVLADRNKAGADALARELSTEGQAAVAVEFDVAKDDFVALRDAALDLGDRVDIVVNNAGTMTQGNPDALPVEEWRRVIEVNLMSIVRSNAVFMPVLIAQGSGHIVNTASMSGLYTYSVDRMAYAASKAALVQLSEGLALYLKPKGIGVTLLCPGPVATAILSDVPQFSPSVTPRGPGPGFAVMTGEAVGELVVQGIVEDRFLLLTHPQARDVLVARAGDWDGFVERQILAMQ